MEPAGFDPTSFATSVPRTAEHCQGLGPVHLLRIYPCYGIIKPAPEILTGLNSSFWNLLGVLHLAESERLTARPNAMFLTRLVLPKCYSGRGKWV